MTDDGDDTSPGRPSSPRPVRPRPKKVTLNIQSPQLRLPGEDAGLFKNEESSVDLELPSYVTGGPSSEAPPEDEPSLSEDGWDRARPPLTPPPPAPPLPAGVPSDGGALSLVDQRGRQSSPGLDLATEMQDRFALGDYTTALRVAELLLGKDPEHPSALRTSSASRDKLAALYASRLGSLDAVPEIGVEPSDIRWLGLDHKAGFLLSRVDGEHSLEELIDVSGMTRLDALRLLVELLDASAIRLP
ncbi:MAG: hypothetical protein AB7S26_35220 [Sandaracinaceae bacterium]